ncbi:MAG: hypothetical protein JXQ83_03585 [Candidatus Glassbacteria bacterium]|nr:hypothetical protein [Candidatus Glassbacteria bacterium]
MSKKIIFVFLLSFLMAWPVQAKMIGDFNNDGEISLPDVIAFIMHIMDKQTVPEIGTEIGDKTEVSPNPTMGLEGPNEFVSENNIGQLNPLVLKELHKLMSKTWPVFYESESGTVDGDSHGFAEVFLTSNDHIQEGDREPPRAEFTAVFYDYSDDGELFLGGRMNYYSDKRVTESEMQEFQLYNILGTLVLAGSYNAHLSYALKVNYDPAGFKVRGLYSVLSWKNKNTAIVSGGLLPKEQEIGGEYLQGWEELEIDW